jgi:UPF0755 protein
VCEIPSRRVFVSKEDKTTSEQSPPISIKKKGVGERKKPILPYVLVMIFFLTLLPAPLFFVGLFAQGPLVAPTTILIPRGASVQEITSLLDQKKAIVHPLLFRAAASLMADNKLKAGEYKLDPGLSAIDIAVVLRDGHTVLRQLTIPEGLTSKEIVALLNKADGLTGEIKEVPEEGILMPETYRFTFGDEREEILGRMKKGQNAELSSLWDKRVDGLPFRSPREALILASVVEKETGYKAEERARVAGVFLNRLRIGMPLQSDPTVIYALTNGQGPLGRPLLRKDLTTESPYNTYGNAGLPPGPICNPGRAALQAVFNPEKNEYLYFVADGSGGHAFSKTFGEHNKNVSNWNKIKGP